MTARDLTTAASSRRAYFFDDGIRFQCSRCGQCCTGAAGTIYVSAVEIDRIADHLGLGREILIDRHLYAFKDSYSIAEDEKGRCHFFNAGCTIYAVRPLQCRTFPFWFANLRSETRWQRIERHCPGIGQGTLFDRERILTLAAETMHI